MAVMLVTALCSSPADVIDRDGIHIEFSQSASSLAEESLSTLVHARDAYKKHLPDAPSRLDVIICDDYDSFGKYAGPLASYSVLGVAQPEHDLIALKTPALVPPGSDYAGTLRHELVHILLQHNVNADHVPRWLNEGIAMLLSGENRWESKSLVAQMYLDGRVLSYRDLELSFLDPGRETQFGDAYAQAYSMTQYLMTRLGEERFWQLLRDLDTQTFGSALEKETGLVPYDFWEAWRGSLNSTAIIFSIVSGVTLFQIMALLTIIGYFRKRRRGKRVIAQWESEEQDNVGHEPDIAFEEEDD